MCVCVCVCVCVCGDVASQEKSRRKAKLEGMEKEGGKEGEERKEGGGREGGRRGERREKGGRRGLGRRRGEVQEKRLYYSLQNF